MNTFNRAFTLAGLILLTIFGAATLVAPAIMLNFIDGAAAFFHTSVFGGMTDFARVLVRILAAVIFVAILLALVWLEIRGPASRIIELTGPTGERIRLNARHLEEHICQCVDALTDVLRVKTRVTARNRGVVAWLNVETTANIDLVKKREEVTALVQHIIQEQYGVRLFNKPQVTVKAARPVSNAPSAMTITISPTARQAKSDTGNATISNNSSA